MSAATGVNLHRWGRREADEAAAAQKTMESGAGEAEKRKAIKDGDEGC